jgi:hypothetical protein
MGTDLVAVQGIADSFFDVARPIMGPLSLQDP